MEQEQLPFEAYTVEQVATMLCVTPQTVSRLTSCGDLGCIRGGRSLRITREQLERFMFVGKGASNA